MLPPGSQLRGPFLEGSGPLSYAPNRAPAAPFVAVS